MKGELLFEVIEDSGGWRAIVYHFDSGACAVIDHRTKRFATKFDALDSAVRWCQKYCIVPELV
jgi:hypothetical protein